MIEKSALRPRFGSRDRPIDVTVLSYGVALSSIGFNEERSLCLVFLRLVEDWTLAHWHHRHQHHGSKCPSLSNCRRHGPCRHPFASISHQSAMQEAISATLSCSRRSVKDSGKAFDKILQLLANSHLLKTLELHDFVPSPTAFVLNSSKLRLKSVSRSWSTMSCRGRAAARASDSRRTSVSLRASRGWFVRPSAKAGIS